MKNILFIIAPSNFRDEEYFVPKQKLENAGHKTATASTVIGQITGSRGDTAKSEILLNDVDASNYDCVVFVGGSGSYALDENIDAHNIARAFHSQQKLVAAICHGPVIVAKSGILNRKRSTVFVDDSKMLKSQNAIYTPRDVVVDGNIITANGPKAANVFADAIIEYLGR